VETWHGDAIGAPPNERAGLGALAAALVLVHFQTSIGLLFVWAALSIAAATIVGGYHYVADVLSAAMVAIFVFAFVCFVA
jgi:hypothetical protein